MFSITSIFLDADAFTWSVVTGLTVLAFLFVKASTESTSLASIISLLPALGGFCGPHVMREMGIRITTAPQPNTIFSIGIGMIAGFVVAMIIIRIIFSALEIRKPVSRERS